MYNEGSYNKAIRLYELAMPAYATKREAEVINFRLADASFFEKDYTTAVYYYEKFIRSYPKSTEIENGQYRIAESYYNLSPKYSVDQSSTKQAIQAFQDFIDQNPNSTKIKEANQRIDALNLKLEKKAFEIAKQYFKIGNYKSAIVAFDNVILDFLGTSYKEESMFSGVLQSFGDAPGGGAEELKELMYSIGVEYWYDKQFAVRAGYYYENPEKGDRQYLTVGIGIQYNIFGINLAYLVPTNDQRNPLDNTLRFSLIFDFEGYQKKFAEE